LKEVEVWGELQTLLHVDEIIFHFDEINQMIEDSPTEALAYLDGLFIALSEKRSTQLAEQIGQDKTKSHLFQKNLLHLAWKHMRVGLNVSMREFQIANEYIKISDSIYAENLRVSKGFRALNILMEIAQSWISDCKFFAKENKISDFPMSKIIETSPTPVEVAIEKPEHLEYKESNTGFITESGDFLTRMRVLQSSSKESVVHAESFGSLRAYMHVVRPIQEMLTEKLEVARKSPSPSLILLCGSVGDGKSHLLAYLMENRPDLFEEVLVHNDSTEAHNPSENALETLERVLHHFDASPEKARTTIIAINLGVLHNFYHLQKSKGRFNQVTSFIDRSEVFASAASNGKSEGHFHLLNFSGEQFYEVTSNGATSRVCLEIIRRITAKDEKNPFYKSWLKDIQQENVTAAHQNFELLQHESVQQAVVKALVEAMIKQKVIISMRALYNFIYDIIVPVKVTTAISSLQEHIDAMLPNLLFAHPDRSHLLHILHEVDPVKMRLQHFDMMLTRFIMTEHPERMVKEILGDRALDGVWERLSEAYGRETQLAFARLLIRNYALLYPEKIDDIYESFVQLLFAYYTGDEEGMGEVFELLNNVLYMWKGSPRDGYIYIDPPNKRFRMAITLKVEESVDEETYGMAEGQNILTRFEPSVRIGYQQDATNHLFDLDYSLFALLKKVASGYRPTKQDVQNALQFAEFHEKLIQGADKTNKLLLVHTLDYSMLEISKPKFSKSRYEVKKVK
jgi:DNA phosphorothioation-dependent restriction protein DptF